MTELALEGSGYRSKTRFARFINVPELMTMFRQSADIRTAEMLQLDVPEAEYETVTLDASPMQKEILQGLAERAENIRAGQVDASVDNMLAITTDGKKMALDIRVFNPLLPEDGGGKTEACVTRAFSIWEETKAASSTQLIFSDLSTPQKAGGFSVYQDIKDKLMARGVPGDEIAFIHDADTEVKKDELFRKVRTGQVRILIGSTAKMGAGTNCQDKCVALHHLDAPWRPADIEQREGRIIRFGNENKKVKIFRYVTQGTFDGYLWQVLEAKQRFISQVMSGGSTARTCEDIDDAVLNYAEVKACCADNPLLKERMELDVDVSKLRILKSVFKKEHYRLQDLVGKTYPRQIADCRERITRLTDDAAYLSGHPVPGTGGEGSDEISMEVLGSTYNTKKDAGAALLEAVKQKVRGMDEVPVGQIGGFELSAYLSPDGKKHVLAIRRKSVARIDIPSVGGVAVNRILQSLEELPSRLRYEEDRLKDLGDRLESAKAALEKPFDKEEELRTKSDRLIELDSLLSLDERVPEIAASEPEEGTDVEQPAPQKRRQ